MPAFIGGAMALGAGLDFAGGMMTRNASTSIKTKRRRGKDALARAQATDALFGGLERAEMLHGQKQELAGFQGARKAMDLGAMQARQTVQAMGKQNVADMEQSAVSSGLLGGSPGVQRVAGAQDRTTAQLAAIDQQLAQQLAQLGLEEGAVRGEQGRERTALAARNRAFQQGIGEGYFSLLTM